MLVGVGLSGDEDGPKAIGLHESDEHEPQRGQGSMALRGEEGHGTASCGLCYQRGYENGWYILPPSVQCNGDES